MLFAMQIMCTNNILQFASKQISHNHSIRPQLFSIFLVVLHQENVHLSSKMVIYSNANFIWSKRTLLANYITNIVVINYWIKFLQIKTSFKFALEHKNTFLRSTL